MGNVAFTVPLQILILLSVAFAISTIIASILAIRLRQYALPIKINSYFKNQNITLTQETANEAQDNLFGQAKINTLLNEETVGRVKRFIVLLKVFRDNNAQKADFVSASTYLLLSCVFVTLFSIVGLFWLQSTETQSQDGFRCDVVNTDSSSFINNNVITESKSLPDTKIMLCMTN